MARHQVRYLVARLLTDGRALYYWQPSAKLRAAGWEPKPLEHDDDTRHASRREALRNAPAAVVTAAQARNREVDGGAPPAPPAKAKGRAGKVAQPGTCDALFAAYKASRFFTELGDKTRYDYAWCLDILSQWCGDKPVKAITAGIAEDFYSDQRAVTPVKAALLMRVARLVWNKGPNVKVATPDKNPFARMGLEGADKSGKPWPRDAVAAFVAVADALKLRPIGTAVALDEWIGQRQADVLELPRSVQRSDGLFFGTSTLRADLAIEQNKTGAGVILPVDVVPALMDRLRADAELLARRPGDRVRPTTLIADERTGRPYNASTFRHDFIRVRDAMGGDFDDAATADAVIAAGGPWVSWEVDYLIAGERADEESTRLYTCELIFKDLRHTAVLRLVEAGVDILGISAITGHSPKAIQDIITTYLRRNRATAVLAFQKRLAHEQARKA